MKKNVIICIIMSCILLVLSGCSKLNLQDDYILKTNESSDEELSGEKVNEIFEKEKVKNLMDKLKTTPAEVAEKLDESDSESKEMIDELNEKADELTEALDDVNLESKADEIKEKLDDISNKLDEIKDKVDDTKDNVENKKDNMSVDKEKVTDIVDEFSSHMNNLQSALSRFGE